MYKTAWPMLALLVPTALAGETPSSPQPTAVVESFLQRVGKGEVDAAIDALPKGGLLTSQPEKVDAIRRQTKLAIGAYGGYLGIERIRETQYSPSMVRLMYLMKLEEHFLVWSLVFYRPKDQWQLAAVSFFDHTTALE
jgi:hypothetical protein